jgi:hypothetical protein
MVGNEFNIFIIGFIIGCFTGFFTLLILSHIRADTFEGE